MFCLIKSVVSSFILKLPENQWRYSFKRWSSAWTDPGYIFQPDSGIESIRMGCRSVPLIPWYQKRHTSFRAAMWFSFHCTCSLCVTSLRGAMQHVSLSMWISFMCLFVCLCIGGYGNARIDSQELFLLPAFSGIDFLCCINLVRSTLLN